MGPEKLISGSYLMSRYLRMAIQCFNGAGEINLRKSNLRTADLPTVESASMGPEKLISGSHQPQKVPRAGSTRFNGAGEINLRKSPQPQPVPPPIPTASMGPEKLISGSSDLVPIDVTRRLTASMGPEKLISGSCLADCCMPPWCKLQWGRRN